MVYLIGFVNIGGYNGNMGKMYFHIKYLSA